jgi:RHS repeat-associated protein
LVGNGWTGQEEDPETGFYNLRARYYSPLLRRFMQEDPIGYGGGSNLYAYVGGDPLELVDPTGTEAENTQPPGWYMAMIDAALAGSDGSTYYLDGVPVGASSANMFLVNTEGFTPGGGDPTRLESAVDYTWRGQIAVRGIVFDGHDVELHARQCASESSTCDNLLSVLGRQDFTTEIGQGSCRGYGGDGCTFTTIDPVKNIDGEFVVTGAVIRIDPSTWGSNPWKTNWTVQLVHEMGHVINAMQLGALGVSEGLLLADDPRRENYSISVENQARQELINAGLYRGLRLRDHY